jgi:hypothetical protein
VRGLQARHAYPAKFGLDGKFQVTATNSYTIGLSLLFVLFLLTQVQLPLC